MIARRHPQIMAGIGAYKYKKLATIADIFFSVDIVREKKLKDSVYRAEKVLKHSGMMTLSRSD